MPKNVAILKNGMWCALWQIVNTMAENSDALFCNIIYYNIYKLCACKPLNSIKIPIFACENYATMKHTLFLVLALVLIVTVYFMTRKGNKNRPQHEEHHHDHDHGSSDSGCCGRHANCEKGTGDKELYFDDEELDRFKGVAPAEYSDEDVEEFRQVLYTMNEDEVDNWVHCLQLRGIELPEDVKEEVLVILRR